MDKSSTQKSPERRLIGAIIICLVGGLALLGVPALIYFQGHQSLIASPSASSVPVATYNSVADLAHWFMFDLMPLLGFCFLVTGYLIWGAYRMVALAKKKDDADA